LWVNAVQATSAFDDVRPLLDSIAARADLTPGQAPAVLLEMADRLPSPANALAARKAANLYYEQRQYEQFLAVQDKADAMAADPREAQDMEIGFKRALALVQLGKHKQAIDLLRQAESWVGTDDQHAQALYLIGWTNLQTNQRDAAISVFEEAVKKYPSAGFSAKAADLIRRLKGGQAQ
jgi:tetratricopeptide (TPR) repeat protein